MPHFKQAKPLRSSSATGHARRRFTPSVLVLALSSALALPGTAFAVDWVGGFSSIWMDDANWNPGTAPTAGQNATIDTLNGQVVTVDGTNAVANSVVIGATAGSTGAVDIVTAGILTTSIGQVGAALNATGTVTVGGAGASWVNGGILSIGNVGTGSLDISAGGVVNSNGDALIGQSAAAAGTVTVSGAGSQFSTSSTLTVGDAGTGTLTITNGGAASNTLAIVGAQAGSSGTVNIDGTGAGATWTNTQGLVVGSAGTGVVNITNGGTVSSTGGNIGSIPGSNGTVTVDNSTWTATGSMVVGNGGTGNLDILNGGVVSNANGFVGETAGISGTVTVAGTGSTWTNNGALTVGDSGTGTVNVTAGGTLESNGASLGAGAGSTGNVTIDGTGSTWTAFGVVAIGNGGTGTLTISNAGAVTAAGAVALGESAGANGTLAITGGGSLTSSSLTVGDAAGSVGTATIDGAGSNFQTGGFLRVGNGGTGTLTISNGGSADNTGDGVVGSAIGSNGVVLVTGTNSKWTTGGDLTVGDFGRGLLTLASGGSASANAAVLGSAGASTGTLDVNGAGSAFTATGSLLVGAGGTGVLKVFGGATVSNAAGFVGQGAGSTGTATVSGAGSTWTNTGDLLVGEFGTGTLAIQSGGVVNNVDGTIASSAGSTGIVTVDGVNSAWHSTGGLTVGDLGAGTLLVSNGGVVTSNHGVVDGTAGVATVDGAGSLWDNFSNLFVGNTGSGTLDVSNGGAVSTNLLSVASAASATGVVVLSGGGTVNSNLGLIGNAAGANGSVTVGGAGSKWTNTGNLTIGRDGTGRLTIKNGGVVNNFDGVMGANAGSNGAVTVDGAGSAWNMGGNLAVGGDGTALLMISNGGVASSAFTSVGSGAGSTGTLTVTGAGSALNMTGGQAIVVGSDGTGNLNVFNSGTVATAVATIGQNAGSIGDAKVVGAGSVWNNTGALTIGDVGTGILTIGSDGVVNVGGLVTIAAQGGSTGTLNIGNTAVLPPVAPGTLNAANVVFGVRSGAINFNHTDTSGNYSFDAAVGGTGIINHLAGWTKMTADSSAFDGVVNVNGGRLAVNGSLANATLNVNNGGNLGGSGTVGLTFVNNGGTVSPGNSIGTLNVNGNITFAVGSAYQVEVDPAGNSDKIIASGTAQLDGGTVQVIAGTGNYAPLTSYDILTAQGGVTGKFDSVSSNFAFLDPSLSYSAKGVSLTLVRNSKSFTNVGLTPNQKAAGTGTEALGSGNVIFDAVLGLSVDQARNSFDQLSGEIHPAARGVQLEDSRFVRDASLQRLRALDSERPANDGGADTDTAGKPARLLPSVRDLAYWAHAMGSWGHVDGDGNAATVKRDTAGFLMGADTRFGEEGRFGLVGGYSRSSFDITDRNSSGSSENYHLGAYAGSRWGDLALRTGLAYSWHDVSTSRSIAFPGFRDSLQADYKANTTQAFAELGYRIKTERADLEPFVNLANVNVSSDGFTERGGPAALRSAGSSNSVSFATLGLRAGSDFSLGGGSVSARGSIGWRSTLGDVTPTTALAFAGGTPFVIAGVPIAKSAAVVEAGLDFRLSNAATLGLSYGGQFGSGLKDHSARVNLNVAF